MAAESSIEWTNATWNVLTGCSLASPGCIRCYAMRLAGSRLKNHFSRKGLTRPTKTGPVWTGEVRFNEVWLRQPLQWRRPRKIFVCAHSDLFHDDVPDEVLDQIFAVMALASHHTFQVLTKRSARMRRYLTAPGWADRVMEWVQRLKPSSLWNGSVHQALHELLTQGYLPNVWLGVSTEDQRRANERVPDLLATPAAGRYLSVEPLIGEIDLTAICAGGYYFINALSGVKYHDVPEGEHGATEQGPKIDWVIVGGESGDGARPMMTSWARYLRDQCAAHGTMFMFKQWGAWAPMEAAGIVQDGPVTTKRGEVKDWMRRRVTFSDGRTKIVRAHSWTRHSTNLTYRVGKKAAGRLLDGREHNDMPMAA